MSSTWGETVKINKEKGVLFLAILVLTIKIVFNLVHSFRALVHHVVELLQEGRGKTTSSTVT